MRRLLPLCLSLLAACYDSSLAVVDEGDAGPPDDAAHVDAGLEDAGWVPPVPFDGALPPDDPGPGHMVYAVDSLDLGTDANTGFDLDGFDTRSVNEPIGCGILDGEGGVDNRLQNLVSIGSSFGFDLGSLLFGSSLGLEIEIRGYEGRYDDWVRADVRADGTLLAEDAPGLVTDGVVEIHFDGLPLPVSPTFGGSFDLPLELVRLRFDLEEPEGTQALLGGALVWDDGGEEDLESLVQSLIDRFAGFFPVGVVETVIESNLDVALEAPEAGCDAISLASFAEVRRIEP